MTEWGVMPDELLITNVRPMRGEAADVRILDGRIDAIGRGLLASYPDATTTKP